MATGIDERTGVTGPDAAPTRRRWLWPALAVLAFILAAGALGVPGGKLAEVEQNDAAAHLPAGAEATRVLTEATTFTGVEATSAIVVYTKIDGSAFTEQDRVQIILVALRIVEQMSSRLGGPPMGPILSDDGSAAEMLVLFLGSDPEQIRPDVDWLRQHTAVPGMTMHVSGPAGAVADLTEV